MVTTDTTNSNLKKMVDFDLVFNCLCFHLNYIKPGGFEAMQYFCSVFSFA